MDSSKLSGNSADITEEQKTKLRELFPEVFSEDKIDWQKLKASLGEEVELGEQYGLSWKGKSDVFRIIQEPTTKTLKPVRDESVNFDETENVFIEGDNLEALKILQKAYYGKIKMIYIDPPYNTGNDFVYNDKFAQKRADYEQEAGLRDENGQATRVDGLRKNSRDGGHYHSDWLNMMYPRLYLARNLLRKDGAIFVSIDDNEVHDLRLLMGEIFGEENFVAQLVWKRRQNADNRNQSRVSTDHEYVLVFARDRESFSLLGKEIDTTKYKNPDNDPRGPWASIDLSGLATKDQRPNLHYNITDPETGTVYPPNPKRGWSKSAPVVQKMIEEGRILFPKEPSGRPREKKFLNDLQQTVTGFSSWLESEQVGFTTDGTRDVSQLFDAKLFDFPKPVKLLSTLVNQATARNESDIVLDFFSGSGTLAHAIMDLNASDDGNRKWICIQLPEKVEENGEAHSAGYPTIAGIAKERIRRAAKKIPDQEKSIDLGFKALRLTETNFKIWDGAVKGSELRQQMLDHLNPVKGGSTEEDILAELALKSGISLAARYKRVDSSDGVYYLLDSSLAICLEAQLSSQLFESILSAKPKRVVLLDSSLHNDDQLKTNFLLRAEKQGVEVTVV